MLDVLIIGGGVSGVSCALVLGSAGNKTFAAHKQIAIITHQKTSSLQEAVIHNAYGISSGKTGAQLLVESLGHLRESYPHVTMIEGEKVLRIEGSYPEFTVFTNKKSYQTKLLVIAIGYSNTFAIEGLTEYVMPHEKAAPEKQRIQLRNADHKVAEGIYVAGNLAGWRSQVSIASGSGAAVATDILTLWNNGQQTQSHDKIQK